MKRTFVLIAMLAFFGGFFFSAGEAAAYDQCQSVFGVETASGEPTTITFYNNTGAHEAIPRASGGWFVYDYATGELRVTNVIVYRSGSGAVVGSQNNGDGTITTTNGAGNTVTGSGIDVLTPNGRYQYWMSEERILNILEWWRAKQEEDDEGTHASWASCNMN